MAVTMGFVLRVDSYPPAVAIPPLPPAPRPVFPVIETQKIIAASSTVYNNQTSNRLLQRTKIMMQAPPSTLTYSAHGIAQASAHLEGGRLLDTYG